MALLKTWRRYFVTKIKCTCILKTQCLPRLISFVFVIGQEYTLGMLIRKAYNFRLKPHAEQRQQMINYSGACRFLWNKVLKLNLDRIDNKQGLLWYHEADHWSKLWKASDEYGFLKEAPAHCLQQKLKDLTKAFKDGFDKQQPLKRLPKFKKRGMGDSFRFPEPKQIVLDNRRIKLPKLGWIRFFKSRPIEGKIKNATISMKAGHWYVALQVELELPEPCNLPKSVLGVDMGISQFAACSDGRLISPKNSFRSFEVALGKLQKQLARKVRFSQNWKKVKARIQKLHSKIAHSRHDFLHKLSTQLSKNHAMLVVEDLKINNMSRSAKGDLENPGKQVKAKSGLNKSILDQGWGEFRRQLDYKLKCLGGVLLKVDPKYTSQRCHACGHTSKANRQTQAKFCCQSCGHEENADINAAKNILAAGHAVLACGEDTLVTSMKQELLGIGDLVPA